MSLSVSKRRIPSWIGEAFSVVAARELSVSTQQRLASRLWMSPTDLELAIRGVEGAEEFPDSKWLAYQQSGWIFQWLAEQHGERKLVPFLAEFGDESLWRNLKYMLFPPARTSDALRKEFGLTIGELFQRARERVAR